MIRISSHPAFASPLEDLKNYFSKGDGFLKYQTHLSFVCGANGDQTSNGEASLRSAFLHHLAKNRQPNLLPILAEVAIAEFSREPEEPQLNLNEFESLIAESVDSILIFPESPGSFAELGLFSGAKDLAKKVLVANRTEHQGNSFITFGPLHHVSSVSDYRPLPIIIGDDLEDGFDTIVVRLLGDPARRNKRRLRFEYGPLKELRSRAQLAVIAELVAVCAVLTERDLKDLLGYVFERYELSLVRRQLALLVAMKMIRRSESSDIIAVPDADALIDFPEKDRMRLKGKWINAYREHDPSRMKIIAEVTHGSE